MKSVIVQCFVVRYFMSTLVLQSSWWGKRELVALLNLSSWCLVMVEWLFLAVPWGCLRFVIVVFPDHTHLLFLVRLTCCFDCFHYTSFCTISTISKFENQSNNNCNQS